MMKHLSKSLADTGRIAGEILVALAQTPQVGATVLLLQGDLGSGKTALTQQLARQLGVRENLISPTFVLMKKYRTNHPRFKNLLHLDAYRLDSARDLARLGWAEWTADPSNLIVLEWPERVAELFTGDEVTIKLRFVDEKTRTIASPL